MYVFIYNNTIDTKRFVADNSKYLEIFREEDYTFLIYVKYGEEADADRLYMQRVFNAILVFLVVFVLAMGSTSGTSVINSQFFLNLILATVFAAVAFKSQYSTLRRHYKAHLHDIDIMLPYYLKSLEILIQHYTVPVALGKSIDDAPEIFKPGLRRMIEKINGGDASIDPYMEFANTYPVRDSMRMMRLLYRLGIGSQEKKQERLLMFSRTVSSLQNKARETKYKERLNHMESQTMIMLVITGMGTMLLLLVAMMMIFSIWCK